jgi:hypothetical protein
MIFPLYFDKIHKYHIEMDIAGWISVEATNGRRR